MGFKAAVMLHIAAHVCNKFHMHIHKDYRNKLEAAAQWLSVGCCNLLRLSTAKGTGKRRRELCAGLFCSLKHRGEIVLFCRTPVVFGALLAYCFCLLHSCKVGALGVLGSNHSQSQRFAPSGTDDVCGSNDTNVRL